MTVERQTAGAVCRPCTDAAHPYEHRSCVDAQTLEDGPVLCQCRCRTPRAEGDVDLGAQRRASRNPATMLDHSEVTIGCWVEAGTSTDLDATGRGGVVVDIDRIVVPASGELVRVYRTAREWRGSIRWSVLEEANVDRLEVPNPSIVRHLWRAMGREIGGRRRAVMPDELRLGETIRILQRSVA